MIDFVKRGVLTLIAEKLPPLLLFYAPMQRPGHTINLVLPGHTIDRVHPGHTIDRVRPGHTIDRVRPGHTKDRVRPGHTKDRVRPGHSIDRVRSGHTIDRVLFRRDRSVPQSRAMQPITSRSLIDSPPHTTGYVTSVS